MTRKQKRISVIGVGFVLLASALAMVSFALQDTIVFFYGPSDVVEKKISPGVRFRLGGLVKEGSVKRGESKAIRFTVTDLNTSLPVVYVGILPDLFGEGQGVVTEGKLNKNGVFEADSVLAKHDENYMPAEVAQKLKEQGKWVPEKKS
jgi:cytochrome c-type biogenesis protein CcmE